VSDDESPRLKAAQDAIGKYFDAREALQKAEAKLADAKEDLAIAERDLVEAVPMGRYRVGSWVANEEHDVILFIDAVEDTPRQAIHIDRLDDLEDVFKTQEKVVGGDQ
jgi:hypothetical protein